MLDPSVDVYRPLLASPATVIDRMFYEVAIRTRLKADASASRLPISVIAKYAPKIGQASPDIAEDCWIGQDRRGFRHVA